MGRSTFFLAATVLLMAAACEWSSPALVRSVEALDVDGEVLSAADDVPGIWASHGRTYSEQRYSHLKQIDTASVKSLGLAWMAELDSDRGMEATPIVVDGTMYVTSAWSIVYALDARTGERKWTFDPGVNRASGFNACCDVVNRGVALWKGKVFVGTIDGRLIALSAETGKQIWSQITVDQAKPYTITGAPRVIRGKVLIGNGGAEYGVRGYISAYDAEDGELSWRFYTTPNPAKTPDGAASDKFFAEKGNASWGDEGDWKATGGGGTVWDGMAYDPELDILYVGVGNGTPWNQRLRDPTGRDNLLLSSILALKPETGAYVWHYQTTPGESWDYTATQPIILANLTIDGKDRKVLMQAPKNGFFYVIDRSTGELISADKYQANVNWASGVDLKTGRPVEAANARYTTALDHLLIPGSLGAHNWQPMAFSPETGLVYIPAHTLPENYSEMKNFRYRPGAWNTGTDFSAPPPLSSKSEREAEAEVAGGELVAWDPVAKKARWSVSYPNPWNGGVLATAGGLVFQGALDGYFRAYDAAKGGAAIWQFDAHYPALAGPVSFEIDGEQYVAVTAGWGTSLPLSGATGVRNGQPQTAASVFGRVLVFKIGGNAKLDPLEISNAAPVPAARKFGSAAAIAAGEQLYANNCLVCHGGGAQSSGITPDLRWSQQTATKDAFSQIVLDGRFAAGGMASFKGKLSSQEVEAVRAYVVERANADAAAHLNSTPTSSN
ncbi:MAG: PQQ-dependent dehydrogenase, methanol/ethanol family [Hyphomonadaceae bacterium]